VWWSRILVIGEKIDGFGLIGIGLGRRGAGRGGFGLGRHELPSYSVEKKEDDDGCMQGGVNWSDAVQVQGKPIRADGTQQSMRASLKRDLFFFSKVGCHTEIVAVAFR
jgi:hypothetical protein